MGWKILGSYLCTGSNPEWVLRKEGDVYLTTFIYGSDSERGNLLPPHGLLFPISSKGSFICTIPQTGLHIPGPLLHQSWITRLEREIAQWVHPMKDRSDDPSHHERTLLTRSYISLPRVGFKDSTGGCKITTSFSLFH